MSRERPISFTLDLLRAVLAETKVETRRPCPVQPQLLDGAWQVLYPWGEGGHGIYETEGELLAEYKPQLLRRSPFGKAGDQLYVRESALVWGWGHDSGKQHINIRYEIDGTSARVPIPPRIKVPTIGNRLPNGTFREASRFKLTVLTVRIERLHAITEAGAIAEGCASDRQILASLPKAHPHSAMPTRLRSAREEFHAIWNTIYGRGQYAWASNPYVFVCEFKRSTCAA